jgi:hypothetical protein
VRERLLELLNDQNFRNEFYEELGRAEFVGMPNPREKLHQLGPAILNKDQLEQLARDVLESLQHAFYKSEAAYRQAAPFMENRFGITIKVDRFMGGPRRDIVLLLPGSEVKIFMRWKDFRGKYVMHCHNVVHEDHAMMIRWDIIAPDLGSGQPRSPDYLHSPEQRRPHMEPHPGQATAQEGTARRAPNDP